MANVNIVASVARVVAAVLAILVVRGIDTRQEERSKYVHYAAPAPPPPPLFAQTGPAAAYDAPAPTPGADFNTR